MTVTVTSALAGPATARYSNVYGALVDLGVLSGLGAQDVTGSGDPVAPILNAAGFYAPLTHSLVLTRGTGNPTYSRATNAWEFDNEGKLILVPSGSARFGGARMVWNIFGRSVAFDNASHWTPIRTTPTNTSSVDPLGGSTAYSLFETAVTNTFHLDHIGVATAGISNVYVFSVYVKANGRNYVTLDMNMGGISGYACFDLSTGTIGLNGGSLSPTITSVGNGWYRCSITGTTTTLTSGVSRIWISNDGTVYPSYAGDITKGLLIWGAQLENVTGQADQTASEYVSVGVLAAPYHGAGTDGVKYFNTNKDGSAISASSLLGYHAEDVRTNSLINSRILTNRDLNSASPWGSTVGTGSEIIANGTFDDATGWTLGTGITVSGGVLNINNTSGSTQYADIGVVGDYITGKEYIIEFDYVYTSGNAPTIYLKGANTSVSGLSVSGRKKVTVAAGTSALTAFRFNVPNTCVCTIDNLTVKEATVQVTTCTGIDNAANSASTLTAGAADATILQTLSLAAAARSFSAYVKRRTGSGNIYITRDGGTTWTDVTSQINSSTWTRVKIENTSVLNPVCGFKLATSGDAIDVDVCQDEAGAFASSPIITTTAAVTRNADALTYQVAGNIADAAGTVLATWKIFEAASTYMVGRNIIGGIGSTGILYGRNTNTVAAYDSTSVTQTAAEADISVQKKTALSWTGATRKLSISGAAPVSGAYDGAMLPATLSISDTANPAHAHIRDVYVWSTALTDAQLQQVTV